MWNLGLFMVASGAVPLGPMVGLGWSVGGRAVSIECCRGPHTETFTNFTASLLEQRSDTVVGFRQRGPSCGGSCGGGGG